MTQPISQRQAKDALDILKLGRDVGNRQVAIIQAFIDQFPDVDQPFTAKTDDYEIDWDKVQSLADVKALMRQMVAQRISERNPAFNDLRVYLRPLGDEPRVDVATMPHRSFVVGSL